MLGLSSRYLQSVILYRSKDKCVSNWKKQIKIGEPDALRNCLTILKDHHGTVDYDMWKAGGHYNLVLERDHLEGHLEQLVDGLLARPTIYLANGVEV
jgi:hypothetical protein